ncbi:MAG: flagellar hook capping protein [wastewater metagenome]|nr:flagellar hook capping protein [Candidatus Loosdrechtia aerotolerans]
MEVSSVGGTTTNSNFSIGGTGANTEDFLHLLITQLQNQDPMEPLTGHEFVAQLAQFNSVEQLVNLNTSFQELFEFQQVLGGSSLIGRTATYLDINTGGEVEGIIVGVKPYGESTMVVMENGEVVPISYITGIYDAGI